MLSIYLGTLDYSYNLQFIISYYQIFTTPVLLQLDKLLHIPVCKRFYLGGCNEDMCGG